MDLKSITDSGTLYIYFFFQDIGTWSHMVELNLGTNQIAKLPDDIANLQNLEVRQLFTSNLILKFVKEKKTDRSQLNTSYKLFESIF